MSGKISITREELTSAAVDRKISSQQYNGRAAGNAAKQPGAPLFSRLLYNALFYMTAAGCIAGLTAWGCGELIDATIPDHAAAYLRFVAERQELIAAANSGQISHAEAQHKSMLLLEQSSSNPFGALQLEEGLAPGEFQARFQELAHRAQYHNFVQKLCWFSCAGMLFAMMLASVEHLVSRNFRAAAIASSSAAVVGLIAGVAVSLSIDWLYHSFQGDTSSGPPAMWRQMLARSIAWGAFGGLLSMAPGVATGSLKRMLLGFAGGLTGGLLGGLLFDPVYEIVQSDNISRLFGLSAIGVLAGLCSGLFENAARTGWLQVTAGLIAGKQFILYRNPTLLGSSPQCEIYLFKDPCIAARHAAIAQTTAGFQIEEVEQHTGLYVNGNRVKRTTLKDGDEIQTGGVTFTFRQRSF